jgi:hypothetical protein
MKSRCKFNWPSGVRILPVFAINGDSLGYGYHIFATDIESKKKAWLCFAYTWAWKPLSKEWFQNLLFMADANELDFLQLTEKLKKRLQSQAEKKTASERQRAEREKRDSTRLDVGDGPSS